MQNLDDGRPYAFFNNITYTAQKVPTLYTVLTAGNLSTTSAIYSEYTNPFILNHMDVIEVILNNNDTGTHPFHLHGHNFQVIDRTPAYGDDFYTYGDYPEPVPYDPHNHTAFPQYPIRRDVVVLPPQGSVVLRFVADNPGVWFFHCHIDWHLSQGLGSLFIEAPLQMQEKLTLPQDHIDACKAAGVAYEGNAAAKTVDLLDLSGQNAQRGWIPSGFTARGIVALVFSCVAAFVGMAVISWYGIQPMGASTQRAAEHQIAEADLAEESVVVPAAAKTAS
jgi:iron transport multicopper oxidase